MNQDYLLASRWHRLCAQICDAFLILAPILLGLLLDSFLTIHTGKSSLIGAMFGLGMGTFNLARFVGTGQTLGKKFFGIEAVSLDGSPLSSGARLVRSLSALVMSVIGYVNLLDNLMIFGTARRTLHDRLVGSVVVVKDSCRIQEDEVPDVGFSRF